MIIIIIGIVDIRIEEIIGISEKKNTGWTVTKGWEVHKKIERRSVRVLFLKLRTSSRSRSFFQA